jgi:hypothetical protein
VGATSGLRRYATVRGPVRGVSVVLMARRVPDGSRVGYELTPVRERLVTTLVQRQRPNPHVAASDGMAPRPSTPCSSDGRPWKRFWAWTVVRLSGRGRTIQSGVASRWFGQMEASNASHDAIKGGAHMQVACSTPRCSSGNRRRSPPRPPG